MTGEVFDIKRFAVHDGPGIRCTAFLKGCPLGCIWCHNPEGKRSGLEVGHFPTPCIHCMLCVRACPQGAIREEAGSLVIEQGLCTRCGQCVAVCPSGAMVAKGETMTVDALMAEFAKEEVFFQASGGGITLSGGDPLFQPGFTGQVLKAAKARGYHTAVETCLFAAGDVFDSLLSLPELWLVDLKLWDDHRHQKLTGQTNRPILRNYEQLASSGRPMLTRIPVIPGCTDDEENLCALAAYIGKTNPGGQVELMFYNPLAASKYEHYHMDDCLGRQKPYTAAQQEDFRRLVAAQGIHVI